MVQAATHTAMPRAQLTIWRLTLPKSHDSSADRCRRPVTMVPMPVLRASSSRPEAPTGAVLQNGYADSLRCHAGADETVLGFLDPRVDMLTAAHCPGLFFTLGIIQVGRQIIVRAGFDRMAERDVGRCLGQQLSDAGNTTGGVHPCCLLRP